MQKSLAPALRFLSMVLLVVPLAAGGASIPDQTGGRERTRRELAGWFAQVSTNAPTVFGELEKSPATMKAIQERIAAMSDEELDRLGSMMAASPDWKLAPEAVAGAFPPGMLEQVRRVASDVEADVPEANAMRQDVATLAAVLRQLPDEKLGQLGIDREMLAALDATFDRMSAMDAALVHDKVAAGGFDARAAAALNALPDPLETGALALAQHGPLTEADYRELETFRASVGDLLRRIDALPVEPKATLKASALAKQIASIESASPDVLYMMRHHVTPEMLQKLEKNVAFLEESSRITPEKKEALEGFRSALADTFARVDGAERGTIDAMLAELGPAELSLLQRRMEGLGSWQTALPIFYQSLGSPEMQERLAALQEGGTGSPEAIALEAFRGDLEAMIGAASVAEGVNPDLAARALRTVRTAPLERLEMMRTAVRSLAATAPPDDLLTVVALYDVDFSCYVDLGCIDLVVDEWCLGFSLDFICNPIESAIEAVANGITATVNTIVNAAQTALQATINAVQSALNTAISAVSSTVNSLVSGIEGLVNTIADFIEDIPDLAWEAIQAALDALLSIEIANGITVGDLVAEGVEHALTSLRTAMGLAGDWWTAISTFTLPAIPCPAAGFHTPFGDVGDQAAADNYGRYKLLIDNIVGMIPDTETSLAIKIPAQVLYMAFDFLGVCLDQAAADADTAELTARHDLVLTNFSNVETFIGLQIAGVAAQSGSQTDALLSAIESESTIIQNLINLQAAATDALVDAESDETEALVESESDAIRALLGSESSDIQSALEAFRDLNLRLIAERALQSNLGSLVLFQLPEPWGHLGLVRDIVQETILAMTAAGQGVGNATQLYTKGVQAMNAGKFKDALTQFEKAYRDATK